MAQFTVQEIYNGLKYDVLSESIADYMAHGRPADYDEQTWIDLLLVKYAIEAAERMIKEGDSVSTMIDNESSSSYVRWDDHDDA